MIDLYELRIDTYPVEDDHVAVSVQPHNYFEDLRQVFTLAEWHRAWTDIAGVLARLAATLVYDFDRRFTVKDVPSLTCASCRPMRHPLCGVSAGPVLRPTDDWGDAPWTEVTAHKRDRQRAIDLIRNALDDLAASDAQTFSAEEEAAWKGDGS